MTSLVRLGNAIGAAGIAIVLLIACANVAILVIAQWTAREHEIAIRASLGASRARIVRALLTESVLLASMGGVLGIGATMALLGLITRRAGMFVAFFDLSIDPWILIESTLITLLTGVVAGVGPADQRADHADHLEDFVNAALVEGVDRIAAADQLARDVGLEIRERQDQVRPERVDLVEPRVDERRHPRLAPRLGRPRGVAGDADDPIPLPEQIQRLRGFLGEADDPRGIATHVGIW